MLFDKTGTITKNSFQLTKLNHLNENVDLQNDQEKLKDSLKRVFDKLLRKEVLENEEKNLYLLTIGILVCNEVYTFISP